MSERIAVDYTIEVRIRKVLDKGFLEDNDQAPTGDEDALADWLENNPDAVSADLGTFWGDDIYDADTGTVRVREINFLPSPHD